MDDDAVALHERRGGCGELPETVDFQRNVLIIIAQSDIGAALTSGVDLRDLPGHPNRWPPFDGHMEFLAEQTYRPGVVSSGFAGQSWQRFAVRLRCRVCNPGSKS